MAAKKKPLAPLATRVKTDPALLARALRDPGLRSKLPDQYLTAGQRQARQRNQYLGDLGDIGTPLAGQSLVNAAQQTVNADYAPLLADVGQQEQVVNKSAGIQGDWAKRYYGDLNSLLGSIGGAQNTANVNAVQGAVNRGTATQGAIAGADQAAQQRLAQDAQVRGGGLQGSAPADLAARTAAAQQRATEESGVAQQSAQNFGDVQAAFLKGLQGAAGQQGGEYQQQITGQQGQMLAKLGQDRSALQSKQAGAFTDALLKLRGTEQQNAITAAGLGIRQDSAAASADASAGAEGRKYGYTPSEWLKLPAATRTGIVAAANKKAPKEKTGYGPGAPGMNKYGYTYAEWTALSSSAKTKARAGKGSKGGGAGSGGGDRASNNDIGDAQSGTTGALSDARTLYKEGTHDRHKLASLLLSGRQQQTVSQTVKNKDGSITRKVPVGPDGQATAARPEIGKHDALYTSIALDVLIDGHISRYNAGRLHARGLKVEDLGFPSYTDSKKKAGNSGAKLSPSERAPGGT